MQKQTFLNKYQLDYAPIGFADNCELLSVSFHSPEAEDIVSLHYHDGIELGFCLHGAGTFIIDGEVIPYSGHAATVIYPKQFHKANSLADNQGSWVFITFMPERLFSGFDQYQRNLFCTYSGINPRASLITPEDNSDIVSMLEILVNSLREKRSNYLEVIKGIIWSILALYNNGEDAGEHDRQVISRIGPIINYINQQYRSSLTVKQIASAFYITESTLRRWFLDSIGISPLAYLHKVSISNAASLLIGTHMSILDISLECGYCSQSSFNRQFFKEYDCTPLAYRKNSFSPSEKNK